MVPRGGNDGIPGILLMAVELLASSSSSSGVGAAGIEVLFFSPSKFKNTPEKVVGPQYLDLEGVFDAAGGRLSPKGLGWKFFGNSFGIASFRAVSVKSITEIRTLSSHTVAKSPRY